MLNAEKFRTTALIMGLAVILVFAGVLQGATGFRISNRFTLDNREAGTGYGISNRLTIDNREADNTPLIVSLSSQYSSSNQNAYFLAGVPLNQTFTATIDWNGKTSSQVRWYRNNAVIATDTVSGTSVSRTFNAGTAFSAGDRLYVQAVASDATTSSKYMANFNVVSPPPGLATGMLSFQSGKYKSSPFTIYLPLLTKDAPGSQENNALMEIAQVDWESIIDVTAEIDLNGHAKVMPGNRYDISGDFKLAKIKFDYNLDVLLTFDYISNQWSFGGNFALNVMGRHQSPPSYVVFMVGPVPVPTYYRFAVDASVSANCRFTDGMANNPIFSGDIPIGAGVEGMAGVGVADLVAAEGYLRGGLNFDFQVPQQPYLRDWYLSLDGGIRIYLLFYKYENNFLSYRWPEEQDAMAMGMKAFAVENFEPMERDYLITDYAHWQSGAGMLNLMNLQPMGTGGIETALQTNIFGQSNAVLAVSDDAMCLVWLYDEPSRNSLDRTMLVYSINDGSGWSVPAAVDDDGTADATPSLGVDADGNFVCVWANASQLIPDGTSLSDFMDKLDIQIAVYNDVADTWTSESVASSTGGDYSPKISSDGSGNLTVIWTYDADSDVLAETPPVTNAVLARTKTGTGWQAMQTLATVSGIVKYVTVANDSIADHIVYCLDTDSDLETDADNELFYVDNAGGNWSVPVQLTDDDDVDVNPQLVRTSGGLMLLWAKNGQIVSVTDITGMTDMAEVVPQEGSSGQRGFVAAASPTDNISVIWNDPSDAGSDIYTATYDPAMLAWSQVVQMTDGRDMERSITAAYSSGDKLELAYNKVHVSEGDGLDVFGQVDLCVYEYMIGVDLAVVADSIAIDDANAVPGDTVTLQAVIINAGDIAISDIPVAFYCGDTAEPANQIGQTQSISGDLPAGADAIVSVTWTIPVSDDPVNIIVVVDPELQIEDKNRQNNSASVSLFGADLAIENVIIARDSQGDFYITADVINVGFIPAAAGVELGLFSTSDPCLAYDIQTVADLEPGATHTVTLAALKDELAYGWNQVTLLLDGDNTLSEVSTLNNVQTLLLQNYPAYDLVVDGVVDLLDLHLLSTQWLSSTGYLSADIAPPDGDGIVNLLDLAVLAEFWMADLTQP